MLFSADRRIYAFLKEYWEGIMKQTKTRLLCLLFAVLMLLGSLTACGKEKEKDSNLISLGDYELLYKSACIISPTCEDGTYRDNSQ